MMCCGRSWAKCLAAVLTTAAVGPLTAAPYMPAHVVDSTDAGPRPLIVPAPLRGQDRNFDGYGKAASAETPTEYRQTSLGGLATEGTAQSAPSIRGRNEAINAAGWTQPPTEQPHQFAPAAQGHWVAVVGAVAKPGCHELPSRSISVAELMDQCGGLTPAASGTLAVIRDGRALGLAYNPQDRLLGGDVIVVAEKPSIRPRIAPTGLKEVPGPDHAEIGVQLGLVNVLDRPVPVLVPTSHATVAGVLAIANQTHLRPDQIKVIMGGTDEMFGDQSTELTPGTVLVFPPGSVDPETLAEVKTRFYPAAAGAATNEPAPMNAEPALQSLGSGPSMMNAAIAEMPQGPPLQMPPSEFAPSAPDANLTSLPRVEMLDAPDDASLTFPRTADASGAMPIGAPEAGSHIVPFPAEAIDAGATPPAAAPTLPPAVTLSDEAESTEDSRGLPTLIELAPTLLIGTILGAATFLVLRQWRKRGVSESLVSRLSALPQSFRPSKTIRAAQRKAVSPDEMLSALIANRLALREEAVLLAPALQLYGRSQAMANRRVDPPSADIARPHIPFPATRRDEPAEAVPSEAGRAAESRRGAMRVRFDDAEEIGASKTLPTGGTPFERALAAMRSGQK